MKKNTRLILLAVLTLLMVGLLAVAASAANIDVYTDGETPAGEYDNFAGLCEDIDLEGIDPTAITSIVINADTEMAAADGAINLSGLTLPVTIVGNGHTLRVSKDFTLPGDVTIEGLNVYLSAVMNAGKKVTFDGGSITSGTEPGTPTRLFVVNDAEAEIVGKNGFKVTVNKPSIELLHFANFKSATFTGCTFECWGVVFLLSNGASDCKGVLTLNDCLLNTINKRKDYQWFYCGNSSKFAQVVVNGGTYYGKWHTAGARITINSGTFESDEDKLFSVGDGDVSGQYVINGGDFLMSDKTREAVKVFWAYGAAKAGSYWAEEDADKAAIRIVDGTFTVLGNGSVIDDSMSRYNVVIENGTFTCSGGNQGDAVLFRLCNASNGSKFIIRDGEFTNVGGWRGLFNAAGASIEITGGNFESDQRIFGMHDSAGKAFTVDILGGTYKSTGSALFFMGYAGPKVKISGGTFESTGSSIAEFSNASYGGTFEIVSGVFNYNPTKAWDGNNVRGVFSGSGATIVIDTAAGKEAPVFNTNACIFRLMDNDVLSPLVIKSGVFNATGNGRIFLINANTIKYTTVDGKLVRSNVEEDGVKKGRVNIYDGTFSSEFGAAIEYTTVYELAQVNVLGGDFTACRIPLKMCTDSQLTGIELLTAGCIATNTFHMTTPSEKDGSSVTAVAGTTWYKDVEALWNNLDNSYEDGEITLLADQNYAIDLTGHNFYAVVHVNGKAIDPEKITGATLNGLPTDGTVTMDCSKTVIASSQVTLKDNIVVSFKGVRLAHGQTKLVVTIAGKRFELNVADAVQTKVNAYRQWHDGAYHSVEEALPEYTFTFEGLVPQCYDTNVTITDEAGTGTAIFNLKAYCEAVKADKPEFTAVVDALLVYGEAARQYVEGEEVTAPEGFETPTPGDVSKTEITGVVFKSARLNLADKVSLVFRVELTGNLAEYTVTVGGNPVTPVLVEGTTYDITVDLAASQLTGGITLSVVKGEETATLIYGVANYIVNMQSNTAIANFLKAIWLYGVAAAAV